ncbi:MAG: hypothetical protein ACU85V_03780 [Gammaproteobacteria bacterium]
MSNRTSSWLAAVLGAVLLGPTALNAQQVYTYPNAGQSEAQQSQDRFECHQWAIDQSGFDPTTAPPLAARPSQPPPPPPSGYSDQPQRRRSSGGLFGIGNGGMFEGSGMMGDAATGAALGAAGGAIAGNAGEGAAIGALASTLFGALNRSSQPQEPPPSQSQYSQAQYDYYRQQQAAADADHNARLERIGEYNRAFGACMRARDYTVN